MRATAAKGLREDLLVLKYLGSNSKFLREMAHGHAKRMPNGDGLLAPTPVDRKPKRGRPRLAATAR